MGERPPPLDDLPSPAPAWPMYHQNDSAPT